MNIKNNKKNESVAAIFSVRKLAVKEQII